MRLKPSVPQVTERHLNDGGDRALSNCGLIRSSLASLRDRLVTDANLRCDGPVRFRRVGGDGRFRALARRDVWHPAIAGQRSRQQQRDRDGDRRDEDQRLTARHAPHRAPLFMYEMVHNLGEMRDLQIRSQPGVARSPHKLTPSEGPGRPMKGVHMPLMAAIASRITATRNRRERPGATPGEVAVRSL
jgi:hypothetical protein